jgi:hypothetical protein
LAATTASCFTCGLMITLAAAETIFGPVGIGGQA